MNAGDNAGDDAGGDSRDDLREIVRASVLSRSPVDERERRSNALFIEHFDRLEHPFDESAASVHVTGSAIVVGERGVILLLHKRLGRWMQPGGHIDPGEAPWEAALREAQEETGLDVRFVSNPPPLVHVDVHSGATGHTHLDLRYLVDAPDVDPNPPIGESQEVHWFGWDAALQRADDGVAGALRQIRDTLGAAAGEVNVRTIGDGGVP